MYYRIFHVSFILFIATIIISRGKVGDILKSTYDPVITGKVIRDLRKNVNMTLQTLADGICSIGKMSYIENGHTILHDDELQKFAEKLNTTVEYLKSPSFEEEEKFFLLIKDIEVLISMDLLEYAQKQIEKLKRDFKRFLNRSTASISLIYLEGSLNRKLKNESASISMFYKILSFPIQNQNEILIHSKAHSQLGEIQFHQDKFSNITIEIFKKAKMDFTNYKLDVPFYIDYNLSLLYLYQREYSTAKSFLNSSNYSNYNADALYLDALLTLFTQDSKNGLRKLYQARHLFMDNKRYDMMLKTIFASIYFKLDSNNEDNNEFMLTTSNFIKDCIPTIDLNNSSQLNLFINLLHCITHYYIKEGDEDLAIKHCKWTEKLESDFNFYDCYALTLTLKSSLLKTFKPDLISERKTILNEVLEMVNNNSSDSYLKIHVLSELGEIYDEKDTYSFRALRAFENTFSFSRLDYYYFDLFMPDIISLN